MIDILRQLICTSTETEITKGYACLVGENNLLSVYLKLLPKSKVDIYTITYS